MILWTGSCVATSSPPHCCCDWFIFSGYYFSSPVVHITHPLGSHSSSPLCSGMASGINQSIILFSLFSLLSLSLCLWGEGQCGGLHHSLQFWGWFCVLSQDKQLFLCVSKVFGSGYTFPRPFYVQWNERDTQAVVFIWWDCPDGHSAFIARTNSISLIRIIQHKKGVFVKRDTLISIFVPLYLFAELNQLIYAMK